MTRRIVVHVSGMLRIRDAAQPDKDDLRLVNSVQSFVVFPIRWYYHTDTRVKYTLCVISSRSEQLFV